jgi:hypothetical protein
MSDIGEIKGKLDMLIGIVQQNHSSLTAQLAAHITSDQTQFDTIGKRILATEKRTYGFAGGAAALTAVFSAFVAWVARH